MPDHAEGIPNTTQPADPGGGLASRWDPFDHPPLPPAASDDDYFLHRVALQWSLEPPITIQGPEDIESRAHWQGLVEPYRHQIENLITFCRRAPVALIADDVGLGKTISAGLILSELMARGKVRRALVICPMVPLLEQWVHELQAKFALRAASARGAEIRTVVRDPTLHVVVTTYDTFRDHESTLRGDAFQAIVLDEAHKLRNLHGTRKPPILAQRIRGALKERAFRFVLMLTATPIQNRLWDLYSLVDCLAAAKGHTNPFGNPEAFSRTFMADSNGLRLRPSERDHFRRLLSQYMVRLRRKDVKLSFPKREVVMERVSASRAETELLILVRQIIETLQPLQQSSIGQALMSSPQALVAQLRNMAEKGSVSLAHVESAERILARGERPGKLQLLAKVVEELSAAHPADWRLVIFTQRRETQDLIGGHLRLLCIPHGFIRGSSHAANRDAIEGFTQDPPRVRVLVSTDAGTEGLNLQKARWLINYDLPWNPMVLEQRIGRIQRLGSRFPVVHVLNFVLAGSVEETVVARLMRKLQLVSEAIGDIEAILDGAEDTDSDGNAAESFEARIRKLVVDSLRGMDTDEAMRLEEQSILDAKTLYEASKEVVEANLGSLDAMHNVGPAMPRLSAFTPDLPLREFVLRALRAQGSIVQSENGRLVARRAGRPPEYVEFDRSMPHDAGPPSVFGAPAVAAYHAGSPSFARLTESWIRTAGHRVLSAAEPAGALRNAAQTALDQFEGIEILAVHELDASVDFHGRLLVHAASYVYHDRYEKLLDVDVSSVPADHRVRDAIPMLVPGLGPDRPVRVQDLVDGLDRRVQEVLDQDKDLGQFTQFYADRCKEEVARVKGAPTLDQVRQSYTPTTTAKTCGAEGLLVRTVRARIQFRIDGRGDYEIDLRVLPAGGLVLDPIEAGTCSISDRTVPTVCLTRCEVTGSNALAHLMVRSEKTDRLATPDQMRTCDASGVRLLADETAKSDVSGKLVDRDLLVKSMASARRGLRDELAQCEFTQAWVLPDEIAISDFSARRFRADQKQVSSESARIGHLSEGCVCSVTGGWLGPGEFEVSACSGKAAWRELFATSDKSPGRRGLEDEFRVCAATQRRLLLDELETCAVSGLLADPEAMVQSAISGRLALPQHTCRCQETGAILLTTESAVCERTALVVDARLLKRSEVSGRRALGRAMDVCEETARAVVDDELLRCGSTGRNVARDCLDVCSVSGKLVLSRLLVTSAVSGRFVERAIAVFSTVSQRACAPGEEFHCPWSGPILPAESGICQLTAVAVDRTLLNPRREFGLLRALLDRGVDAEPIRDAGPSRVSNQFTAELAETLGQSNESLAGLRDPVLLLAPHGNAGVLVGEVHLMLGLRRRVHGAIVSVGTSVTAPRVLGQVTIGKRSEGKWSPNT